MAFQFRDNDGNVVWEAEEGQKILTVTINSDKGEKARVHVHDLDYLSFDVVTTGTLVPNLIEVEEQHDYARRQYVEERNASSDENPGPEPELNDEQREEIERNTQRINEMNASDEYPNTVEDDSKRPSNRAFVPGKRKVTADMVDTAAPVVSDTQDETTSDEVTEETAFELDSGDEVTGTTNSDEETARPF